MHQGSVPNLVVGSYSKTPYKPIERDGGSLDYWISGRAIRDAYRQIVPPRICDPKNTDGSCVNTIYHCLR